MSTNIVPRFAVFQRTGESATYLGLFTRRPSGKGLVFTTHRAAMAATRQAAPNGPTPGQTRIAYAMLERPSTAKGVFTKSADVQARRDALAAIRKADRADAKAFRAIRKTAGF